ncbi:ABC transporter, ATP binding protein (branched chain amino acid) [Saccharolobus solfataricus P2]|uniref:Probable branched-chain amino acid transport ATP-binding protein LivG n=2 Tax=Saccharolobus solfataricus TaxID=2287 RepID=Q97V01_SACS2|nr:ABC transporter ATP-binding protein [Saccharolobus solfataricus]AAK42946.1 ABC transporter, ATP binding protein (branched chain amino acid) [Saccharolobus solfataricus P2]SAI86494.1 branched-chain amino acid transport ATP-binding protein [Saccharolobus solfataricus]
MSLLKLDSVSKYFGGIKALDSVTLEIENSKFTLLIGPNGSGKSTLINVVTGIYKPDSGSIFLEDRNITGKKPHELYKLGIVRTFQNPQIFPNLSVLDNVILGISPIKGESILRSLFKPIWLREEEELAEKAYNILKIVKLDRLWDRPARELSGGQLKLLEIARSLMTRPRLLVMDEPLAGVNPQLAKEILNILTDLKRDIGIFVVEHRLDIVANYADYVYAMFMGKVIAKGSVNDVLNNPTVVDAYLG